MSRSISLLPLRAFMVSSIVNFIIIIIIIRLGRPFFVALDSSYKPVSFLRRTSLHGVSSPTLECQYDTVALTRIKEM
jgi:hypothetical protein